MSSPRFIILGPQRRSPQVKEAVASLKPASGSRIATVTAGWEEREAEDLELNKHLGGAAVNLKIYQRADEVYQHDPELHQAMRRRHDTLRKLQEIYRLQLHNALESARALIQRKEDPEIVEPELEVAIQTVRNLDQHHFSRVSEIHQEFQAEWQPSKRTHSARHCKELSKILKDTSVLCIAGGHVAILLNRMRVFELLDLYGSKKPIIAWSAGAMAMSERVILFHDSPPQGPGDAEILVPGFGAFSGVVPLPHAKHRLRLNDQERVALFARRFGPDICCSLDDGTRMDWNGKKWTTSAGTLCLSQEGSLMKMGAA